MAKVFSPRRSLESTEALLGGSPAQREAHGGKLEVTMCPEGKDCPSGNSSGPQDSGGRLPGACREERPGPQSCVLLQPVASLPAL